MYAKNKNREHVITIIILVFSLVIIGVHITSLLFPALIVRATSQNFDSEVNPFEIGVWAMPLVLSSGICLGLAILYWTKKLPRLITNSIFFILKFEISAKKALVLMLILLAIYIAFTADELTFKEVGTDAESVIKAAQNFELSNFQQYYNTSFLRYMLLHFSDEFFDNIRFLPFLASIILLIITFLFTYKITQKRFAGLISVIILVQANVFQAYDTISTYTNFWTLFFLLSLYLMIIKWPLSPFSFILSFSSKALSIVYFPINFLFIFRSKFSKRKKVALLISYSTIILFVLTVTSEHVLAITFNTQHFWAGFSSLSYQLRSDGLILSLLLPLTIVLYVLARKKILYADWILFSISWILFSSPLLTGITDITLQPYRQIPFILFFSIGIGVLFSKKLTEGKN